MACVTLNHAWPSAERMHKPGPFMLAMQACLNFKSDALQITYQLDSPMIGPTVAGSRRKLTKDSGMVGASSDNDYRRPLGYAALQRFCVA
jgi:hypothetical protein